MTELYLTVIFFKKIVREIFQFIISFFPFLYLLQCSCSPGEQI